MERNLGFLISAWESLIFDNLHHFWAFQTLKNQNLLQPWWNKAQITILPTLCHHSIMLSNLTNCEKWGQCVCVLVCVCVESLLKMPPEKSFWTPGLPKGFVSNRPCPSIGPWSVRLYISQRLFISFS